MQNSINSNLEFKLSKNYFSTCTNHPIDYRHLFNEILYIDTCETILLSMCDSVHKLLDRQFGGC